MSFAQLLEDFEESLLSIKRKLNFAESRSSTELLLRKFKEILKETKSVSRSLAKESSVLYDILNHCIISAELKQKIQAEFMKFFNCLKYDWSIIVQEHQQRSSKNCSKAEEIKRKLEYHLGGKIDLTGSVASDTAGSSRDFDFGLEEDVNWGTVKKIKAAFKNQWKSVNPVWGKIRLVVVKLNDGTSIDVVGHCTSMPLQQMLKKLDWNQKLTICCMKGLLKALKLIDTRNNKLPSCAVGIALLCANKDSTYEWNENQSFFSQLCTYIVDFDFTQYQMTTNGPIIKRSSSSVVEIVDLTDPSKPNNCTRSTGYDAMVTVQLWFELFAELDDMELVSGLLV